MMITAEAIAHCARMIEHANAGTLAVTHKCDDCDREFASQFDAEIEHGVIRLGKGDFSIVIACEGYHPHSAETGELRDI